MNVMEAGLYLMALGLFGVFLSLIVFYIFIKLLLRLSRGRSRQ